MQWSVPLTVLAAAHRRPVCVEDILSLRHVFEVTGQFNRGWPRFTDTVANSRASPAKTDQVSIKLYQMTGHELSSNNDIRCWGNIMCHIIVGVHPAGRTSWGWLGAIVRVDSWFRDALMKLTSAALGSRPSLPPHVGTLEYCKYGKKSTKLCSAFITRMQIFM